MKEGLRLKTKDMILIALFAILTAVGAYISIPIPPVPVTLQGMVCILAGAILGSKRGALSQILYTLMGLVGLPVFAGGKGGISSLVSPTFGYIIGFIVCAYIVGKAVERSKEIKVIKIFAGAFLGTIAIYAIGTSYLYGIINLVLDKPMDLMGAIKVGVVPFFIKDTIVALVSSFISKATMESLKKAGVI